MKIPKIKYWRGPLVATLLYIALYPFYIFVLLPLVGSMNADIGLLPMLLTGHALLMLSIYLVPHGLFCEETAMVCTNWQADAPLSSSMPWVMDGKAGYCLEQIAAPTAACAERVDVITVLSVVAFLWVVYLLIGFGIEYFIAQRRQK